MSTRSPSRQAAPSLHFSKSSVILAAVSALAGVIVGVGASISRQALTDDSDAPAVVAPATTTDIKPGSGVTNDSIQPSALEGRRWSITGRTGHVDSDPSVILDPSAGLETSSAGAPRGVSPTGRNGIVDPDPSVLYGSGAPTVTEISPGSGVTPDAVQPSAAERRLSPTGRNGIVDPDPSVLFGADGVNSRPQPTYPESREGQRGQVFSD